MSEAQLRANNGNHECNQFDKSRVSPKTCDITGLPTFFWLVLGRCSISFEGIVTNRDSDLALTTLLYSVANKRKSKFLKLALFGELSMGDERTIQLVIATEKIVEVCTVRAALSKALSIVLCLLVCASGCDGCV